MQGLVLTQFEMIIPDDANNAAIHSAILSIVVSAVLTVIALLILESLLKIMGASSVLNYAMDYGVIIFAFTAPILIPPIFGGAFRAEGDIKRATLPIAIVAVINMILDPIFIYVFGWGTVTDGYLYNLLGNIS